MSDRLLNLKGIQKLVRELYRSGYEDDLLKQAFYFIEKHYPFVIEKPISVEYLIELMDFQMNYYFKYSFINSFVMEYLEQNDFEASLSSLFEDEKAFKELEVYLFGVGRFHAGYILDHTGYEEYRRKAGDYIYESIMKSISNNPQYYDSFMSKAIKNYFNAEGGSTNLRKTYNKFKDLKDSNGVEFFKTFINNAINNLEEYYDSGTYITTIFETYNTDPGYYESVIWNMDWDEWEGKYGEVIRPDNIKSRIYNTGILRAMERKEDAVNAHILKEYIKEPLGDFIRRNDSKPWISDFIKLLDANYE